MNYIIKLEQELSKYCKQLGITEYPKLIFTLKEYETMGGTPVNENIMKNRLGITFRDKKLVCIRINDIDDEIIGNPIETLIHELIHYRFPSMPHGDMFDNFIKQTLEGQKLDLYLGD